MAKYCSKCGKELKDKKCTCSDSKLDSIKKVLIDTYQIAKDFMLKPIDTLERKTDEESLLSSIVLIILNGLLGGCFILYIISKYYKPSFLGFASILTGYKIPYFKYFIVIFLIITLINLLTSSLVHLTNNKLLKQKSNIKEVIALYGITSVILSISFIIALVLSFISLKLAILILLLGLLLFLCYSFKGLEFVTKLDKNKLGYLFVSTITVSFLIITYIIPKIMF